MYAGQNCRHIIGWAPSILEDIQAEFTGGINIRMEHLTDELDRRRFIRVLLLKMHNEPKGTVFEGSVCWSDDDGVPEEVGSAVVEQVLMAVSSYQVITLSATGEAETPAGGSVCIRCGFS